MRDHYAAPSCYQITFMKELLAFLRNKHGLWFKLGLVFCCLVFIIYLLPDPNANNLTFQLNKPWDKEDLIAPFDFAVYKSSDEIKSAKRTIEDQAPLYYTENDSLFKNNITAFFANNFNMSKPEEQIWRAAFDSLVAKKIIEIPDTIHGNPSIWIVKNNIVTEKHFHDFYTLAQADSFLNHFIHERITDSHAESVKARANSLNSLTHTLFFNRKKSDENLNQELNDLALIRDKRIKGQTIINKGEVVNADHAAILESLQKEIRKQDFHSKNSVLSVLGKSIYVGLCLFTVFMFLGLFRTGIFSRNTYISFIFLLICFFILVCSLTAKNPSISIYAIPFAIAPVIVRTFFDTRTALFVHLNTILLAALFAGDQKFSFLFIELLCGIGAIFSVANLIRRSQLLVTALVTLSISMLAYFSLQISTYNPIRIQDCYPFLFASAGLLLAYPLIYVCEKIFGFISDFTLLELNDISGNPLLKQLATDAPGTFQHSLQVANMAEEAIRLVGGKALLVRTGAMYHDIGKLHNPYFFTENQSSKVNPHEDLSYTESAKIIINHVIKGIEMAHKNNLPEQIIDFIRTHHGTTLASFFYYKSAEENPAEKPDEKAFRYPGPIPFSKETAVLMLADSVEASSRSLKSYDALQIDELVERIFSFKMNENQLINSDLTLRDLTQIKKIFKKRLMNMYHVRIEYPKH